MIEKEKLKDYANKLIEFITKNGHRTMSVFLFIIKLPNKRRSRRQWEVPRR